jgi:phenylpropionate dioxygenase-like ring-hydroxylating dioxygenase large terminal subunit
LGGLSGKASWRSRYTARDTCGYHGLQFDASGKCVKIPAQDRIPESAPVRSYPVEERHRCVWLWMGDTHRADPKLIPNPGFLDDPAWGWRGFRVPASKKV